MTKVKKNSKNEENKKVKFKKFIFIPIVIILVVAISYLGKYIYNRYLEYEETNKKVEIYR